jgi:hypothetical protein
MTVDGYFEFISVMLQVPYISTCKSINRKCRGTYTVFLKIHALILTRTSCYEYLTLDRMLYLLTRISSITRWIIGSWKPVVASRAAFHTNVCSRTLFGFKITTDPHIHAPVNTECPDDRYLKLKIYVSGLITDSHKYIPVAHVTTNCVILP